MKQKIIRLHKDDTVAVAIESLQKSETVQFEGNNYTITEDVPVGFKIALKDHAINQDVIKYGFPIGHAIKTISAGDVVHTHNIKTNLGETLHYNYTPEEKYNAPELWKDATVQVYKRPDGNIAVRNELWIIPLVGCINKIAENIAEQFRSSHDLSMIDGIHVWTHPFGCSQLGGDLEYTQRFLASLATHPNAGGVLLIGLGCENNTFELFSPFLGKYADSPRIKFISAQIAEDEILDSVAILSDLLELMKKDRRETVSFFDLRIGVKCGGSDAFSGITANPLLGSFTDSFSKNGGCVLMTEVPEMFGAETLLMNRAESPKVFGNIVELINDFKEYYNKNNQPIYENPSPGNKAGGISTLEDKSLGCTQKGGKTIVSGVLKYSERLPRSAKNLWLIEGPGNDQVSVSNLSVAGAHIVLFTTGRGNPYGGPVPTIKVSSNTNLAERKSNWIDIDAGKLLNNSNMVNLTEELGVLIQKVASGQYTKNEQTNNREIAIFKRGVTL